MAIGVARMLGFRFKENFALPYFSKSVTEFWRRWHISLSSWLRDYLYISFGGSRKGKFRTYINLMLTMLIGGLWHGASWNFVIWGGLNGLYLAAEKALGVVVSNPRNVLIKIVKSAVVFILICVTWVYFRATTFTQANEIMYKMGSDMTWSNFNPLDTNVLTSIFVGIGLLFGFEYNLLRKNSFDAIFNLKYGHMKLALASLVLLLYIVLFGNSDGGQFIYFQF
jgi:D-alanyl-lipoteichoic acid acyltransferase DltB (MBOAT superfamily)